MLRQWCDKTKAIGEKKMAFGVCLSRTTLSCQGFWKPHMIVHALGVIVSWPIKQKHIPWCQMLSRSFCWICNTNSTFNIWNLIHKLVYIFFHGTSVLLLYTDLYNYRGMIGLCCTLYFKNFHSFIPSKAWQEISIVHVSALYLYWKVNEFKLIVCVNNFSYKHLFIMRFLTNNFV